MIGRERAVMDAETFDAAVDAVLGPVGAVPVSIHHEPYPTEADLEYLRERFDCHRCAK